VLSLKHAVYDNKLCLVDLIDPQSGNTTYFPLCSHKNCL